VRPFAHCCCSQSSDGPKKKKRRIGYVGLRSPNGAPRMLEQPSAPAALVVVAQDSDFEPNRLHNHPRTVERVGDVRSTVALVLAVYGVSSTGCSLSFTKGPQPEVHPPPPCTTDNGAPIADTVLAVSSVALATIPWIFYANAPRSDNSGIALFAFWGSIIGGFGAAIFTTSAVVGFNQTAACRTSLGLAYEQPASSPVPQSSFLLVPEGGCPMPGEAPRLCSSSALSRY
jgi:hypothetical protein